MTESVSQPNKSSDLNGSDPVRVIVWYDYI